MAAEYCSRICCCEGAPGGGAAAAATPAGGAQKLASSSAVSRSEAVISTPSGTRPRARQASTCAVERVLSASHAGPPPGGTAGRIDAAARTLAMPLRISPTDADSSQDRTLAHSSQQHHGTVRPADMLAGFSCVCQTPTACLMLLVPAPDPAFAPAEAGVTDVALALTE